MSRVISGPDDFVHGESVLLGVLPYANVPRNIVSVKNYGAVYDGSTDNSKRLTKTRASSFLTAHSLLVDRLQYNKNVRRSVAMAHIARSRSHHLHCG